MKPMVFVPLAPAEARALRAGGDVAPGPAYAATPALRAAFGYGSEADEDADFAAQVFASLRCLTDGADRCVLAAEVTTVPPESGASEFGEVARPGVRWRDVRAVFIDDPESLGTVRAYAQSIRGLDLAAVWATDEVHDFLADHDLLWFDPTELDQALAGLGDAPLKED
ncbi:MAG: hypothetical protein Q4F67_13750 [Propionibacteriaceae bacterium]|nr:hypothetical protein [Propionibacteriaceae bacterium]